MTGLGVASHGRRVCVRCGAMFRGEVLHCSRDGAALTSATADPLLGRRLRNGRYVVRRFIGEGSAGRVYEGEVLETSAPCAIKVLFGELAAMPDILSRFRREAEVAGHLKHPNIAEVLDSGFDDVNEPLYIVMALAPGLTLSQFVAEKGPLAERKARRVLAGVANGLAFAHEQGFLHRDLKPENIILAPPRAEPRLVDFGVGKPVFGQAQPNLTSYGRVVGTPGFIAPEVLRGRTPDHRADLYGLGVTALYALTGKLPFGEGDDAPFADTLQGISTEALDHLDVSSDLVAWVRRLVALDPDGRPADAAEVAAALESTLSSGPVVRAQPLAAADTKPSADGGLDGGWLGRPTIAALATIAAAVVVWGAVGAPSKLAALDPDRPAKTGRAGLDPRWPGASPESSPVRVSRDKAADALGVSGRPPRTSESDRRPSVRARVAQRASRSPAASRDANGAVASRTRIVRRVGPPRRSAVAEKKRGEPEAPSAKLIRVYSSLGERLNRLPEDDRVKALRGRYLDLPIADALRRPERIDPTLQRLQRLGVDVAAYEAQGTSPLRP